MKAEAELISIFFIFPAWLELLFVVDPNYESIWQITKSLLGLPTPLPPTFSSPPSQSYFRKLKSKLNKFQRIYKVILGAKLQLSSSAICVLV